MRKCFFQFIYLYKSKKDRERGEWKEDAGRFSVRKGRNARKEKQLKSALLRYSKKGRSAETNLPPKRMKSVIVVTVFPARQRFRCRKQRGFPQENPTGRETRLCDYLISWLQRPCRLQYARRIIPGFSSMPKQTSGLESGWRYLRMTHESEMSSTHSM